LSERGGGRDTAGERSARSTAEAYTEYRWIETVTRAARTVTESVAAAFEP